jgi:hypothetical protein
VGEIAAAVRVPAALVGAERRLLGLRERADRLAEEAKWLRASCSAAIIDGALPRAIRATDSVARGVDSEIVAARQKVDTARAGYVRQIRQALEQITRRHSITLGSLLGNSDITATSGTDDDWKSVRGTLAR